MSILLILAFLFWIGSTFGWFLELIYRRLVSTGKWINPGFLTGPYLPIYGFSLMLLYGLSFINLSFVSNKVLQTILIILFMGLAITFIEYISGIIFIKIMKVKLWDYSHNWGNIQGIICPLYTFFWCLLGGIYYFFIQSHIIEAINWFSNNLAFSFIIGFFFGILVIDFAHSINLVVKLRNFAKKNEILVKFEEIKKNIRETQEKGKEKIHFLFAFKSEHKLADILNEYKTKIQNKK